MIAFQFLYRLYQQAIFRVPITKSRTKIRGRLFLLVPLRQPLVPDIFPQPQNNSTGLTIKMNPNN
jgi:hypothetical protein